MVESLQGTPLQAHLTRTRANRRSPPATILADIGDLHHATPSLFDREMPGDLPTRALRRKWWEWNYIARCADALGLLNGKTAGTGLGVGAEALMFFFARHCAQVLATDLYSGDTAWREARYADFRRAILATSPLEIDPDRLLIEHADMRELPAADASQDFVWSTSSIEHVCGLDDLLDVFRETARVLKPGGYAILTTEFALADTSYLLPHLNCLCRRDLERLLRLIGPWLEPVGDIDLDFAWTQPGNVVTARRYLKPGAVPYLRNARLDDLKQGHMANPVGLAMVCPIAVTLRRTARPAPELLKSQDLKLDRGTGMLVDGLRHFHAGQDAAAAATLLALAEDPEAPVQSRLHGFRYGLDARLRSGMPAEEAAHDVSNFLATVPARAGADDDCADFFSHVLRDGGLDDQGADVALAGALSPSATFDHALRLACRHDAIVGGGESILAVVAADLVLSGWAFANIEREAWDAADVEGLPPAHLERAMRKMIAIIEQRRPLFGDLTARSQDQDACLRVASA